MAKQRTLNEYRQTKEYQGSSEGRKYLDNLDPVKQVMAQQIDEELEHKEWANQANNSEEMKKNRESLKECPLDPVEEAKILIVDKITKHFQDVMFEMVCEEMGKN